MTRPSPLGVAAPHPAGEDDRVVEYDVVVVPGRRLGSRSYSETALQEVLTKQAADGWRLAWIVRERERLLVVLERET